MSKDNTEENRKKLEISLDSGDTYWKESDKRIRAILGSGTLLVEEMQIEDIKYLIKELDRRFMQLWQKVTFELESDLVDYTPIQEELRRKSNISLMRPK